MEQSVANYTKKLKLFLEKFYKSQTPTKFDEGLDKLLTLIRNQEQTEVESTLVTLPILVEWIKEAVGAWSTPGVSIRSIVAAFALNVAGLLSKNEERFSCLNNNNFFIKLVNVLKARQTGAPPNVKLAYIKLLSSFLDHTSGVEWMIACNFWEDVFQMSLSNNDGILEESTIFMSRLLEKTVNYDESFCSNVVKRIMLPLGENIYRSIKTSNDMMEVSDEVASQYLKPTLRLMGDILEYFLEGIYFGRNDFQVALVFLKNFHLEERISDFMILAQSNCLAFHLGKIMFTMQFLELYVKVATKSINAATIAMSVHRIKNNFTLNLSKGCFEDVMRFCNFGLLFWNLMDSKILSAQVKNVNQYPFTIELIVFQLLPSLCAVFKSCYENKGMEKLQEEDSRELFFHKLFQIMSQNGIRSCYAWRNKIMDRNDLFKISFDVNTRFKKSRKYFSKDGAVLIVQSLMYTMTDTVTAVLESPDKLERFLCETNYFFQVFELLTIFIEEYQISWKDSCEAMDVLAFSFDFVMMDAWPTHVIVQLLKLINAAISKYMAPNLALLLDNTKDSTIALLGPLLYAKLHDDELEVKCAALEVVYTMTKMSNSKFPSLQKVLMDSELPTLVVKMSTCDGESFVRATAIKCLQEMIQVEEIWNNALKTEDLSQKMRDILLNETEGIVRVEAATFMCVAYEQQQFPKDTLDSIYETMIYSSTTDLHWEVKVRALGFWDKVIKSHLQNQGMIDGSFPNVTFSKEHRKIVTLTDSEIRKRLLKVLSQLSSIGCLWVLMSAIRDDCDMEVSKTAVKITQRLVDLFKKYNVRSDCSAPTSPLPTENGMSTTMSLSSGVSVDDSMDSPSSSHPDLNEEIIEQIVNTKDVSLLKNVYTPSDYGSVSNYDIQVRKIVTPNEFLQFTQQQDLNSIISEKKKWLNGIEDLGSLLDDMLKTYDDDVNNMDCY